MKYIDKDIKCPFYKNISRQRIICEAATDYADLNSMQFKTKAELYTYIKNFCSCDCWQGCGIAQAINGKYP